MKFSIYILFFAALALAAYGTPDNVAELWKDYDPRQEPLETELVREWHDEGLTYRYVRYLIGEFKGQKARMAAFYAFPTGGKDLPAVLHMHGGGQRAFLHEVGYYASRGYAAISVNWGGREMEGAKPGEPNTDWGKVDPTQKNVPGYFNLLPGEKFLDEEESPRNCNWYLLTVGCRRGITFLERQPEVDPAKIGIYGHSMGGNLTMYVAGSDKRPKVASPSVGGTGFRTIPYYDNPPQIRKVTGNKTLFDRAMGYENYAPRIVAPTLHLGATNDFHGQMDATYATGTLARRAPQQYTFAPHFNHRFGKEEAIARPLWIDQHLKGGLRLPVTPSSSIAVSGGIPLFNLAPASGLPVSRVHIYYSQDTNPRARFFRDARAQGDGGKWQAELPFESLQKPLFAFANVYYQLPETETLYRGEKVDEVCISSLLHILSPAKLKASGAKPTSRSETLLDDFSRGFHDWYSLNPSNPHHWQHWTRKPTSPKWQGPDEAVLSLQVSAPSPTSFAIVLKENAWRPNRGKPQTYVAEAKVRGGEPQTLLFQTTDFISVEEGQSPATWSNIDELGLCAQFKTRPSKPGNPQKTYPRVPEFGGKPRFIRLEWVPGN